MTDDITYLTWCQQSFFGGLQVTLTPAHPEPVEGNERGDVVRLIFPLIWFDTLTMSGNISTPTANELP